MPYFILGLAVLVVLLLVMRWFVTANPGQMARHLRMFGAFLAALAAMVLLARGALAYALPLGMLSFWLMSNRQLAGWGGSSGARREGRTSKVVTDHLEMELDLDSGAMRGRVLKGFFAGRDIESLAPVEMALLWQDCRFSDPQSAQLIEAYLDRIHPSWREDMARAESESGLGPEGEMTVEQAYEILGLKPGASADDIRSAHRDLMMKLHPDRGGSTYLAAKINEAKDVLLSRT